jgi:hypothetical protein
MPTIPREGSDCQGGAMNMWFDGKRPFALLPALGFALSSAPASALEKAGPKTADGALLRSSDNFEFVLLSFALLLFLAAASFFVCWAREKLRSRQTDAPAQGAERDGNAPEWSGVLFAHPGLGVPKSSLPGARLSWGPEARLRAHPRWSVRPDLRRGSWSNQRSSLEPNLRPNPARLVGAKSNRDFARER